MNNKSVMVIDPQNTISTQLQILNCTATPFDCFESISEAKAMLRKHKCLVGMVVFTPELLINQEEIESLVDSSPMTEWIAVVTADCLESLYFKTFLASAFHDYHTLPLDLTRLEIIIGHAYGKARLRLSLDKNHHGKSGRFGICGNSPVMQALFQQLEKVINADLAVLIGGETGTGKELVAKAIHKHSQRSNGPFVVLNCGAVPANLIQSELFGHERGAFTGAFQRKIGHIEAANGGVLFLDEIGDLPLSMQANLLRVLQERTITRLGSNQSIPVDFRIIAATHIDLQKAVLAGTFREDLYYRLNVVRLTLPPLRERDGDVALLAETIRKNFSTSNTHCRTNGFSTNALRAMNTYHWQGNVRELINRVHRAVILSENRLISAVDLGLESYAEESVLTTLENARASLDRSVLEKSLRANANNVSRAARQLGVSRVTLYRMMNKHNIAAIH